MARLSTRARMAGANRPEYTRFYIAEHYVQRLAAVFDKQLSGRRRSIQRE